MSTTEPQVEPIGASAWLDAVRGPLEKLLASLGLSFEVGVFPSYEGHLEGAYLTVETIAFTYKIGLATSAQGARELASAFHSLGQSASLEVPSAQDLREVRDALGEVTNIVVGGARSILQAQLGQDLTMGLPLYVIGRLEPTSAWGSEQCALLGMVGMYPIVLSVLRQQTSGEAARRRQVERELRENEERLRVILEATPDPVVTIFEDGKVESFNGAAVRLFGYLPEELLGMDAELLVDGLGGRSLPPSGRTSCRALRKDGMSFPVELTVSPYTWKRQAMRSLLVRDVTAEDRARREVEEVNRKMVTLSHAAGKAEVAADILHNVGNVLNSINVSLSTFEEKLRRSKSKYLEQLAELFRAHDSDLASFLTSTEKGQQALKFFLMLVPELTQERARDIDEVKSLARHLDHVKRIVATQQGTASALGVTEELTLAEVVEASLRYQTNLIEENQIDVRLEVEQIPALTTDKNKLQQIIVNLVKNACESLAEARPIDPRVTISGEVRDKGIALTVSDNGLGIPPEVLEKVFSHGFTTKAGGHGFGLHSCALFARQMGGKLTVQSSGINQGARFELVLPLTLSASLRPSDPIMGTK
jgi:PAS domain S-box-containing protein